MNSYGPANQSFELDYVKTILAISVIVLAGSTFFYFQEAQQLDEERVDALQRVNVINDTIQEQKTTIEKLNDTVQLERNRNIKLKAENDNLKIDARQGLVEADFMEARISGTGLEVEMDFSNYGNTSVERVEASCGVYREGSDERYDTFTSVAQGLENRTVRTVTASPTLDEEVMGSDKIRCETVSCTGNCKVLDKNIERPFSDHLRQDLS